MTALETLDAKAGTIIIAKRIVKIPAGGGRPRERESVTIWTFDKRGFGALAPGLEGKLMWGEALPDEVVKAAFERGTFGDADESAGEGMEPENFLTCLMTKIEERAARA
jgi:hypothetical protein